MNKCLIIWAVIAVIFSGFMVISGFSQEYVMTVQDEGFKQLQRPVVPFPHEDHNEKAEIYECSVCHHSYDDTGNKLEDESSEGIACSECHLSEDKDDPIPLINAYHGQCKGCHAEQQKGPVMCGECHVR